MLLNISPPRLSELDELVYQKVVPQDHYLRKVLEVIPWEDFYKLLAPFYSPDVGRPAEHPVLMLKLEYLRYHHNLSDREVIERSVTDLGFRNFLRIPLRGYLPNPSSLCIFRGRLGKEGFRDIFTRVVQTARDHGVVKDRLRIKDATHVIANIAVPSALALVAQMRDKLLAAAEPFEPEMVEGERVNLEMLREASQGRTPKEKLVTRVAQLREILAWADALTPPEPAETNRAWQLFLVQRDLAHMYRRPRPPKPDSSTPGTFRKIANNVWSLARRGRRPLSTNTNPRNVPGFIASRPPPAARVPLIGSMHETSSSQAWQDGPQVGIPSGA